MGVFEEICSYYTTCKLIFKCSKLLPSVANRAVSAVRRRFGPYLDFPPELSDACCQELPNGRIPEQFHIMTHTWVFPVIPSHLCASWNKSRYSKAWPYFDAIFHFLGVHEFPRCRHGLALIQTSSIAPIKATSCPSIQRVGILYSTTLPSCTGS